jgi:hypothetical protein
VSELEKYEEWARRVASILDEHPELDPADVLLVLKNLEISPGERLANGYRRGRAAALYRKRAGLSSGLG